MRRALLGVLLLISSPALAFKAGAGGSAAQFLSVGAGARPLGMGDAYSAVAEGAEAIWWNPAGLAHVDRPLFHYSRAEFSRFFHHDFAAYAHPSALVSGTLAVSYARLSQDSLPVVTNAAATIGSFSPGADAVTFAYAHAFDAEEDNPRNAERDFLETRWSVPGVYRPLHHERDPWMGALSVGASVKLVSETLYDTRATAMAVDIGALLRPYSLERASFSLGVRNVGSKMRFISQNESLPAEAVFGLAYDHRTDSYRLLPAVELSLPRYGSPDARAGIEWSTAQGGDLVVAARAGFRSLPASELGAMAGMTFGAGARWKRFSCDFGFEPMAGLGPTYRLSVGLSW